MNPLKIAVASGKGGTGKTTVSVNLFYFMEKYFGRPVHLADCDVEEPNAALFLDNQKILFEEQVSQLIPEINTDICTFCRKCAEWCEFSAITIVGRQQFTSVDASLCHSCGACIAACDFGAIIEKPHPLGVITHTGSAVDHTLTTGRLVVGSSMQTMLIRELKKRTSKSKGIIIYDAPPGTSCPVVQTVSDVDYVILVTEPTPFGLHDLKITVELMLSLQKHFGVIVNKAGLGSTELYQFLEEQNIRLLGEIPFSREYAASYAEGKILEGLLPGMEEIYRKIIENIELNLAAL